MAGIENAIKAAEGDAAVEHELFKSLISAKGMWGGNLHARGETERALEVLRPAYEAMLAHFDDGKHFHTIIESLPLQRAYVVALADGGHQAEAQGVLETWAEASNTPLEDAEDKLGKWFERQVAEKSLPVPSQFLQ